MYGAGVLPEKESPVSVDYGSRWVESIIRTPIGIYGVDTEAKKIWRFSANGFEIISDFKIGEFLNNNIKFDSDEHYPIIGLRNVKAHYDNFKGDVIFTFYDCTRNNKLDFNVVFNERIDKWITRTSWTPLSSENINNIFITFDKNVAHEIGLNAYSLKNTDISDGVVLDSNIYKEGKIGELSIKGYDYYSEYSKEYYFEKIQTENGIEYIKEDSNFKIQQENEKFYLYGKSNKISELTIIKISVDLYNKTSNIHAPTFCDYLCITPDDSAIFKNQYLYKHGQAALFEETDSPKPLMWYDNKDHKFEFEFIVNDNFQVQKIFNNLKIISNKTQPDEIQVWVDGDSYNFKEGNLVAFNATHDDFFPTKQPIRPVNGLRPKNSEDEESKFWGRLQGNSQYKENFWDIEIKPATAELTSTNNIQKHFEFRIRNKYCKIRVIYSGQDPAIITSLQTFYTISYA